VIVKCAGSDLIPCCTTPRHSSRGSNS